MNNPDSLSDRIKLIYNQVFGSTPLDERLDDIVKQANRLSRYKDVNELKMYVGNLLASTIQLSNENGFDHEQLINDSLDGILKNKELYKSLGRKRRVAILGGALDPVTLAHFRTAQFVLNESRWADEVWMMPAYQHIYGKQMADPNHRIHMIEKIIVKDKRIKVCDFEIMNKLSGETYKTAKLLTSWYPHYEFAFIIGQDNANTIQKWVNSEYLMNQAMFIIIPREGVETDTSIKWYNQNPHISLLGMKTGIGNISSSQFKLAYKNKADTLDFVTPEVLQYIQNSRLYEL